MQQKIGGFNKMRPKSPILRRGRRRGEWELGRGIRGSGGAS